METKNLTTLLKGGVTFMCDLKGGITFMCKPGLELRDFSSVYFGAR